MSIELIFLLVYFAAVITIGVTVTRTASHHRAGHLLGGRNLGAGVTTPRLQSTSMSGYMFLGGYLADPHSLGGGDERDRRRKC